MPRKMSIDRKRFLHMKKEVAKLDSMGLSLGDWIERVSAIDPLLAKAAEGIYCGEDGRMCEPIEGLEHMLVCHWHKIGNRCKVEVSYIS